MMQTSYQKEDVTLLLKDITGIVEPLPATERERLIQQGMHYCEMLPVEYVPTESYMKIYYQALEMFAGRVADSVAVLAGKVAAQRGEHVVLVSLARAGIPIGILLKHCLWRRYGIDAPHYSISIIRGRGIDDNAMQYLLARYAPERLLFVDGWIGKGAILRELQREIPAYPGVSPELAVLADPAGMVPLCGTREDILIPSSCLNCTVSGLISRTFLRTDVIGKHDFHGAVYYGAYRERDLSYPFIEAIEKELYKNDNMTPQSMKSGEKIQKIAEKKSDLKCQEDTELREEAAVECHTKAGDKASKGKETETDKQTNEINAQTQEERTSSFTGLQETQRIAQAFGVKDINLVKPGIGETTRVLLRRVPWQVLVDERCKDAPELRHIVQLAAEKHVPVRYYPMTHYKACGIIKKIADT